MTPELLTAILVGAVIAAVTVLHRLAWFVVTLLVRSTRRLSPAFTQLRGWVREAPLTGRLAARHPRLFNLIRSRLTPHSFTGLPLTLMVAAALYLVALLGGLVEAVLMNDGIETVDNGINAFFGPYRPRPLLLAFVWLTGLGAGPAVAAVAMVVTGFLWADRRLSTVFALWVTLLGAETTSWAGKYLVGRARPEFLDVASAISPSFPSGHATASMAVYGFLAYVIARRLPHLRERFEVAFWAAMLILSIGFSRVFLGVHYASDVLSGFLVGAFWLLVGFAIAESVTIGKRTS